MKGSVNRQYTNTKTRSKPNTGSINQFVATRKATQAALGSNVQVTAYLYDAFHCCIGLLSSFAACMGPDLPLEAVVDTASVQWNDHHDVMLLAAEVGYDALAQERSCCYDQRLGHLVLSSCCRDHCHGCHHFYLHHGHSCYRGNPRLVFLTGHAEVPQVAEEFGTFAMYLFACTHSGYHRKSWIVHNRRHDPHHGDYGA